MTSTPRASGISRVPRLIRQAGRPAVDVIGQRAGSPAHRHPAGAGRGGVAASGSATGAVEDWWQRHRSGQSVPEAPDPEYLARTLIGALDIAREARPCPERLGVGPAAAPMPCWRSSERCRRPAEDIAVTRMNRAVELVRLRRFGEAKAELEECLHLFQNDPAMRASVLSSLARLFYEQGDVPQAIVQERRALALREQLPDPGDRAVLAQQPRQLPRTQRHPVRPRRILPPSACRPCLPSRLRAGAGPPDLAAQLRDRSSAAPTPPAPRWSCPAWTNSSPTPPSTR